MRARLILVLCLVLAGEIGAEEKKTLSRIYDPIVLEGSRFKTLQGSPLNQLSLLAYQKGRLIPIPFQIDEKRENGEYAFQQGEGAQPDSDPGFDANDELVFLAGDLGDRAPREIFPKTAQEIVELEITDPLDQSKAWAYLALFSQNPPRSNIDYLRFEVKKKHKWVYSYDRFGYGLIVGSPVDAVYPDEFRVILKDHTITPDILDRQKIRGIIHTKLLFDIDFKFDVLTRVRLKAWNDGPVRVIYRADGYLKLGFLKFRGEGYSLITYYPNCLVWPMYIKIPFSLSSFIESFEVRGYMDYNQNVIPAYVYSESNPAPPKIILDGKTSPEEEKINTQSECRWIAGYKEYGATINRLIFPKEWEMVKRKFYLKEDLETSARPEDDPGEIAVGYQFDNFEKVLALEATYYQIYYFLPVFKPGDEKPLLNILDHPLKVQVKSPITQTITEK